jgi:hypothetical protein
MRSTTLVTRAWEWSWGSPARLVRWRNTAAASPSPPDLVDLAVHAPAGNGGVPLKVGEPRGDGGVVGGGDVLGNTPAPEAVQDRHRLGS